jgi:hypothetical protein
VVLGEPSYQDYVHLSLWSERIMVAFPKTHRLAERNFVCWTDSDDAALVANLDQKYKDGASAAAKAASENTAIPETYAAAGGASRT